MLAPHHLIESDIHSFLFLALLFLISGSTFLFIFLADASLSVCSVLVVFIKTAWYIQHYTHNNRSKVK